MLLQIPVTPDALPFSLSLFSQYEICTDQVLEAFPLLIHSIVCPLILHMWMEGASEPTASFHMKIATHLLRHPHLFLSNLDFLIAMDCQGSRLL